MSGGDFGVRKNLLPAAGYAQSPSLLRESRVLTNPFAIGLSSIVTFTPNLLAIDVNNLPVTPLQVVAMICL